MLPECVAFIHQKKLYTQNLKNKVINFIGAQHWKELLNNRESLVKLILDCSCYSIIKEKPKCREILNTSADLIYRLHVTRINKAVVGVILSVLKGFTSFFIDETVYSEYGFYKYAHLYKLFK